ncbi:MAG TPA: formyltransferase family protein, partial [Anaerolineae bacterium]|nr:formyltransferase family protein [Anaerolineae bacterium]
GPYPLFWSWQRAETNTGVTIHQMDAGLDTGPIWCQQKIPLPTGATIHTAEQTLGHAAAHLIHNLLPQLPASQPTPQPANAPPPDPPPNPADFRLYPHWSAQHAFNFMRGTAHWGYPYPLTIAHTNLTLTHAVSFDPHHQLPIPVQYTPHGLAVQFSPGTLFAQ